MMTDKIVRFRELYAIPSGNGLSRPSSVRGAGYRMINMGELFAHDIIGDIEMERVLMNDKEKQKFFVEEEDLLFARQSLVAAGAGKCSIVKTISEPTTYESHLIRVRLNRQICSPWFYYYLFRLPDNPVKSIVNQCAQAGIRGSDLAKVKVPLPPLPTQRKIAKVLSAYDDLIENNTKRIRILERMAEELYRQMFEYGGRSNAARVGQVKDWFEVTIGRTPPRKNQEYFSTESTDQKWVSIRDMRVSGMFVFDTAEKLTPAGVSESKIHISPEGSILLSFKLTVGLVSITATQVATNEAIAHFETKDRALRDYTYFYLKRFQYGTLGSTSSIANAINSEIVRKMPFVMPDRNLLLKYEKAVGSMFDCIAILARQNGNAIKQRDLLLPRLMSGKLRVEGVKE